MPEIPSFFTNWPIAEYNQVTVLTGLFQAQAKDVIGYSFIDLFWERQNLDTDPFL